MSEELAMWIIGGLLSVLIVMIGFGGKYLIATLEKMAGSMNQMSSEIKCLNVYSKQNQQDIADTDLRVTGIHGKVKEIDHRLIIIETEHKHKIKCK